MIAGDVEYSEDRPDTYVQLTEFNAIDLLKWLGLDPTTFGFVEARDLAARCRRRLWPISRNFDPAIQHREEITPGGYVRLIVCGREEGFLHARTEELLRLAERAEPVGEIMYS
jgi:hypothetical protein